MSAKLNELLTMYPSYKRAVQSYELHNPQPCAGIANYEGMPSGSGASEFFFVSNGRMADYGSKTHHDNLDYFELRRVVHDIRSALEDAITPREREVIELKWMKGYHLYEIDSLLNNGIGYSKQIHRKAIGKLEIALYLTKCPKLEQFVFARVEKVRKI